MKEKSFYIELKSSLSTGHIAKFLMFAILFILLILNLILEHEIYYTTIRYIH